MKSEVQWCISSDMQSSETRGGFESRREAEEQAKLHGYPYVVEETLAIGSDDDVKGVERKYFRL